ncbi:MAG: hypothetical protein J6D54_10300 [Olsenella sp.]|nr:hypothetical protein [Olsenella sp.]
MDSAKGVSALTKLAPRFPQLYVAPLETNRAEHRMAVEGGIVPRGASLAHFIGSEADELRVVDTPTGPVEALFLRARADFECFLSIMLNDGALVEYDPVVRGIELRGLLDWERVRRERDTYLANGGRKWEHEFERLATQTRVFQSNLVVYTDGPYSDVPAGRVSFKDEEWIGVSRKIRLYHECARVVIRRAEPDGVHPIWDEVVGDVVGLLAATGSYDASMAAQFLGITPLRYVGGRLGRQLEDATVEEADRISQAVYEAMLRVENTVSNTRPSSPFDIAIELAHDPYLQY